MVDLRPLIVDLNSTCSHEDIKESLEHARDAKLVLPDGLDEIAIQRDVLRCLSEQSWPEMLQMLQFTREVGNLGRGVFSITGVPNQVAFLEKLMFKVMNALLRPADNLKIAIAFMDNVTPLVEQSPQSSQEESSCDQSS